MVRVSFTWKHESLKALIHEQIGRMIEEDCPDLIICLAIALPGS